MDALEEKGAFFDVKTEAVKTASGKVIPGKKVHVRADDGTPLGIVSTKYKTVTMREVFEQYAAALARSGINLDGFSADVKHANNGARTMAIMHFPAHEFELDGKDKSILRIVARNSYDGRWNYSTMGGALRMACLNGMLLGDWLAGYSEYHTSKLDVGHAAEKVAEIIGAFDATQDAWKRMLRAQIKDDHAWRVICMYANRPDDFKRGLVACREATRQNTATKLFTQWEQKEKKQLGPNAFSVYNTLTHHATHAGDREGKDAISLDLRRARVQSVVSSKYWDERVIGKAA
jgi:hypothetical protein